MDEPDDPRGRDGSGGCVLVVEDDALLRRVIVKILQAWGYAIVEAPDGLAALRQAREGEPLPDLMLLDLMLPRLNGLEVARRVRAERPELPIVCCSAALNDRVVEELTAVGVEEFLPKPFSADSLRASILKATGRADEGPAC